ncbi:(2Fe-2S)-binding protein [Pseudooceanicola nitratireducens]|uniref:(2Fe-2S)-binding protein n=1 Tax=Pseudooceanicola nitratireducens TaxID=517719 RepID=UPI003101FF45
MIVCHCNSISDRDIHAAIDWMRAADADTIITPGKVYRALGKKPDCGSCLDLFIGTMEKSDRLGVPADLANLRPRRGRYAVK